MSGPTSELAGGPGVRYAIFRQLRNGLLDAWERPSAPALLPFPLQGQLLEPAVVRGLMRSDPRLMATPAAQDIRLLGRQGTVPELMDRLVTEYRTVIDRVVLGPRS